MTCSKRADVQHDGPYFLRYNAVVNLMLMLSNLGLSSYDFMDCIDAAWQLSECYSPKGDGI